MIDCVMNTKVQHPIKFKANENENRLEKESNSSSTKVVVGAGLAALASIGIYLLRKGKGNIVPTVEKFKEVGGKFIKGKAFTKDGKPFSGVISANGKPGNKYSLEYVNGVLKESVKKSLCTDVGYINAVKKGYNYDAAGKLVSVDHYKWDGLKNGVFTKFETTDIAQTQADGLKRFAEKQANIEKGQKIKNEIEIKTHRSGAKINDDIRDFDANIELEEGFGIGHKMTNDYRSLKRQYRLMEQNQKKGRKLVEKLEQQQRTVDPHYAERLDADFASRQMPDKTRTEMQEFYANMEEAASKKVATEKFKAENSVEYKRLQKEKRAKRKADSLARRTSTVQLPNGNVKVTVKGKKGVNVIKEYAPDGKTLISEKISDGHFKIERIFNNDGSIKIKSDLNRAAYQTVKIKIKDAGGKYVKRQHHTIELGRSSIKIDDINKSVDVFSRPKNVYNLSNGKSLTSYNCCGNGEKLQILRDSKGNVLKTVYKSKPRKGGYSTPPKMQEVKVIIVPQKPIQVKLANGEIITYEEYLNFLKNHGHNIHTHSSQVQYIHR